MVASLSELHDRIGRAAVIGITGPPGAGKSTLTSAFVRFFREVKKTVGVVAVDPVSPFSGGALLGDRIRLVDHFNDPGVFIRSLSTRGKLGGLSLWRRERWFTSPMRLDSTMSSSRPSEWGRAKSTYEK